MTGTGDCYPVATRLVQDHPDWRVVHATVMGQGPIAGLWHGHAWCECDVEVEMLGLSITYAVDRSNGKDLMLPASLYRSIGKARDVFVYTHDEVLALMLMHEHHGPWHE